MTAFVRAEQCLRGLCKTRNGQKEVIFLARANPRSSPDINTAMLISTSCRCDPGHSSLLHLPRWVMLGGLLLKSCHPGLPHWAKPHVFTQTTHFILASSVSWICPMGSRRVMQEQATETCWPVIRSGIAPPGATERKCWKSDFFSPHISQSMRWKTPEDCDHSSLWWKEMLLSLLMPYSCLERASEETKLEVGDFPTLSLAVLEYKHRRSEGYSSSAHLSANCRQTHLQHCAAIEGW